MVQDFQYRPAAPRGRCLQLPAVFAGAAMVLMTPLLRAAAPSEFDQYLIELINRARANPDAEVNRLSGEDWGGATPDLNEGLPPGQISNVARQPLAFNSNIGDAATDYTQALINDDSLGHFVGPSTVSSRLADAGYALTPTPAGAGESVGAQSDTKEIALRQDLVDAQYTEWFISLSDAFRSDRFSMLNVNDKEAGSAFASAENFMGDPFAMISVIDYAYRADESFITGVAYNDLDGDDFYTPGTGEALGNVPIQVYDSQTKEFVTDGTTFASGGYSFQLPDGIYDLIFDSPEGPVFYNGIDLAGANIKVDHIAVPEASTLLWFLVGDS